jgi:alkyl sulfatase BDS1-like metallo-beta-lactamase superfamily hydrolase
VNGPRAWDLNLATDVTLRDLNENYRLTLRNGVLTHTARAADQTAGATVTSTKARLLQLLGGDVASPGLEISGDEASSTPFSAYSRPATRRSTSSLPDAKRRL